MRLDPRLVPVFAHPFEHLLRVLLGSLGAERGEKRESAVERTKGEGGRSETEPTKVSSRAVDGQGWGSDRSASKKQAKRKLGRPGLTENSLIPTDDSVMMDVGVVVVVVGRGVGSPLRFGNEAFGIFLSFSELRRKRRR